MTDDTDHRTIRLRRRHVRDAILLVAGRGSRLAPLTDTIPKCLLEIGGEPLLVRMLRQLAAAGVHRAWLATGYLSDQIEAALAGVDGLPELHFAPNPVWDRYNNAESVRCAMAAMPEARSFLLCDGDVYVSDGTFLQELASDPRSNLLGVELRLPRNLDPEDMKFQLEAVDVPWFSRRVIALGKPLGPHFCHGESIGAQVVGAGTFDRLLHALDGLNEDDRQNLYYEDVFARLIDDGEEFYTHPVRSAAWTEIDTLEDLQEARRVFGHATAKAAVPA
jgi:choline kinase